MYKVSHCLMYYLGLKLEEVIFLVMQVSFTIASSVHEWMSRFKFIRLYSVEIWVLPSLINVSRYSLLIRDFVKENVSLTLIDNLYWLWFFYSKDTVQTLRNDKFAMINPISYNSTSLSIPPENIRKPDISWYFQGVSKETSGMKWINSSSNFQQELFKDYQFIENTSNFASGVLTWKSGVYGYRRNCF